MDRSFPGGALNSLSHVPALLVFAAGILPGHCSPDHATNRPNILFIAVDDLRPELGCYGKDDIKSPNIDALARNGMVFDRAYCQEATCSPSRTAVMTGVRPDTSKVWDLRTSFRDALPDVLTLGQQFKANGYFVQGMGKIYHVGMTGDGRSLDDPATWSVPWQNPKAPLYASGQGTDRRKDGVTASAEPDGTKGEGASIGSYSQPDPHASPKKTGMQGKRGQSRGPVYECADVPDNTYTDGKVADLAVKTLREIGKKEPFFLAVGFIRPHLPWVAPKKYWDLYDPANIGLATNQFLPLDAPFAVDPNDGEIRSYGGCPRRGPVPEDLQRKFKQAYFASLSYSDAQIGRVLDELRRQGLEKNTIVILWGDHGWKLGEHMAWGKHSNVENDVNAPLILSVPGMKHAGSHSRALVEFVDIYPTLCELAGIPLPGHLEGTSFKPLLDDPGRPWKAAAFSQWPRGRGETGIGDLMGYTMRTDRYRFTIWVDRNDNSHVASIELYDHQRDPQENVNIAGKPENSEIVKQLMEQCRSGWRSSKPPLPSSPSARSGNRGSS